MDGCHGFGARERYSIPRQTALTNPLGIELRRPAAALDLVINQACHATGANHGQSVLHQLQEPRADVVLRVIDTGVSEGVVHRQTLHGQIPHQFRGNTRILLLTTDQEISHDCDDIQRFQAKGAPEPLVQDGLHRPLVVEVVSTGQRKDKPSIPAISFSRAWGHPRSTAGISKILLA